MVNSWDCLVSIQYSLDARQCRGVKAAPDLLEMTEDDCQAVLADKAYDAAHIRDKCRARDRRVYKRQRPVRTSKDLP